MDSKYKRATALVQCLLQANISENSMNGAQKNVEITQPDMTLACPPEARNSTLKIDHQLFDVQCASILLKGSYKLAVFEAKILAGFSI